MAGISAVKLGEDFLGVLQEIASSPLICSKQETLLFLSGWFGNVLREQSAAFQEQTFREEAVQIIYFFPVKMTE